jgi:hypothetical protein
VIKLKKKVFQDLKQGSMSVNEYVTKFTQLSYYARNEVDTHEKKLDCFLNGVIPRSEKEGTKPPYVCPGCSNHTHGNN